MSELDIPSASWGRSWAKRSCDRMPTSPLMWSSRTSLAEMGALSCLWRQHLRARDGSEAELEAAIALKADEARSLLGDEGGAAAA